MHRTLDDPDLLIDGATQELLESIASEHNIPAAEVIKRAIAVMRNVAILSNSQELETLAVLLEREDSAELADTFTSLAIARSERESERAAMKMRHLNRRIARRVQKLIGNFRRSPELLEEVEAETGWTEQDLDRFGDPSETAYPTPSEVDRAERSWRKRCPSNQDFESNVFFGSPKGVTRDLGRKMDRLADKAEGITPSKTTTRRRGRKS